MSANWHLTKTLHMWIRIRAVIIEDEPLAAQYLAALLDDTCQVEVVGSAAESETGLRLCAELRPDAVFVDINLPDKDGRNGSPRSVRHRSPSCRGPLETAKIPDLF